MLASINTIGSTDLEKCTKKTVSCMKVVLLKTNFMDLEKDIFEKVTIFMVNIKKALSKDLVNSFSKIKRFKINKFNLED